MDAQSRSSETRHGKGTCGPGKLPPMPNEQKAPAPDGPLRRLAACPECAAQFDVGRLEAGERFHCSCSHLITVPEPQSHEADVVRCSSCGGPRQGRQPACGFCGADFTLHERDLHTICPGCASRISDKARFCHSCAIAIAPQGIAGVETSHKCPACEESNPPSRLSSRRLGGEELAVLECNHCAGLWLGKGVFRLLEERAREKQTAWESSSADTEPKLQRHDLTSRMYRPCPECGKLMNRVNYGRRSGVILDVCGEHGLWFDQDELETILRWIREGGLSRADRIEHEKRRDEQRADRAARTGSSSGPLFETSSPTSAGGAGFAFAWLIELLLNFLRDYRR